MTNPNRPTRVLIVDDSELVRLGLRTLLQSFSSAVTVVGEADGVASGIREAATTKPDVVLLDVRLPDGTGIDACRQILAANPGTRVLMLTSFADDKTVTEAIGAGAHGYLLKEIDGPGLVRAIGDVNAGKSILDPSVASRVLTLMKAGQHYDALLERYKQLSPQEQRVLALVSSGKTNKEIGAELELSEKTVKNYLSNLFEKLQFSRRSQAAAFYVEVKALLR